MSGRRSDRSRPTTDADRPDDAERAELLESENFSAPPGHPIAQTTVASEDEASFEATLRPERLLDYVGQEPVFRVHAQGNAARTLRGFVIEGDAPIELGATIDHAQKSGAGKVTSAIVDGSRTLALGYLHRTVWEPGGTVTIAGRTATVHALPMEPA